MQIGRNVLIISPNLEPEYCGVSDYVYVLKSFIEKNDYRCSLLALSDKFSNIIVSTPNILRIPFSTKPNVKISLANDFIASLQPDVIYFNLVSYGYNTKGLPLYLYQFLPKIASQYKIVIIAHELWAGNFKNESFKNILLGNFQRLYFVALFKRIKNKTIIVTTTIAHNILLKYGLNSTIVPVFNNIPFKDSREKKTDNSILKLVFFGSSLFQIDLNQFLKFLKQLYKVYNKSIQIDIVGLNNSSILNWDNITNNFTYEKLAIVQHGFSSAQKVSLLMQNADIGITTYMPFFWSKSGSIAAMLAHGLPIVSIAKDLEIGRYTDGIIQHPRISTISQLDDNDYLNILKREAVITNYNLDIFNQFMSTIHNSK